MTDFALQLQNVTKTYGDFKAVDDISLTVPTGAIVGFLGPNGAGKTTTLRMILEIIRPTRGTIVVLGRPSAFEVRDRIGYLPEEKGLYKKMKAWSIVAYFASLKGVPRRLAKRRAYELLEKYGLKDFADARTEALSKGMSQKVQVLASIAHDPDLVILDEPFSGLDPVNQGVMEEVIQDLAARGRTVIFSTHVMQHAERICRAIVLIDKGRIVFDGSVAEAKRSLPRRVVIETAEDVGPLLALSSVISAKPLPRNGDGALGGAWEIHIRDDADPEVVLQACFRAGIHLSRFDHSPPTLHDVFVHMVGPGAREAARR